MAAFRQRQMARNCLCWPRDVTFAGDAALNNISPKISHMKYCFTSLLLLVLAFTFVSCKKDKHNAPAGISGTWRLTDNGVRSLLPLNWPEEYLRLKNDGTYDRLAGDNLYQTGFYQLSMDGSRNLISLDKGPRSTYMLLVDTLSLAPYDPDAVDFIYNYVRMK